MTAPYAMTNQPAARMRSSVARARTIGQPQDPAAPAAQASTPAVQYSQPSQPVRARTLPRAQAPAQAPRQAPAQAPSQAVPYTGGMVNAQAGDTPPPAQPAPQAAMIPGGGPRVYATDAASRGAWENSDKTRSAASSPYNPNAPRYNGISQENLDWANTATTAKRPDGSYIYKTSDREGAAKILNKQKEQDMALADPMSGESLRQRWGTFTDRTGQIADTAYGDMGRVSQTWDQGDEGYTGAIDRMDGFQPTEMMGFDPSFIRDMKPTAQQGWTPGELSNFRSTAIEGWSPNAMRGVDASGVENFDAAGTMRSYLAANGGNPNVTAQGATSGYDPRAAVEEYARGAAAQANPMLADALEAQANAAARSGRLNTGLFDKDKGTVIRRVGEDLNAGILTKAVDAAGIRAGIENTNTRNLTDASIATAREQGNMAALRSGEARDAATLGLRGRTDALNTRADLASKTDSLGLDAAGMIDKNRLTAADSTARLTLDQAQGIDDFNQKGAISYGDLALKRASGIDDSRLTARGKALDARGTQQTNRNSRLSLAQQLWGDAYGMYGDAMSSERDRVTGKENFDREMSQQERQSKRDFWGNIIGSVTRVGAAAAGGA